MSAWRCELTVKNNGEKTQGDRFSVLTGQSHCGEFSLGDEKW